LAEQENKMVSLSLKNYDRSWNKQDYKEIQRYLRTVAGIIQDKVEKQLLDFMVYGKTEIKNGL
jgi:hypothetical protein